MSEEQKAALQRDYIRKNHPHWFPFGGSQCAICVIMDELHHLRALTVEPMTEREHQLQQRADAERQEHYAEKSTRPKPKKKRVKK